MSAGARVTHERPALERITMERAALEPHPRWRRFVDPRRPSPGCWSRSGSRRCCSASARSSPPQQLLSDDRPSSAPKVAADRSRLGGRRSRSSTAPRSTASRARSASDVEASGYQVGADHQHRARGARRPDVMYADGQKPAAQKVASDLGVDQVDKLDDEAARARRRSGRGRDRRRGPRSSEPPRLVRRGAVLLPARRDRWSPPVLVVRARTPNLVLEVHRPAGRATRVAATRAAGSPRRVAITFFVRESDDARAGRDRRRHEDIVRTLDADVAARPSATRSPTSGTGAPTPAGRRSPGRYRLLVELPGEDREMILPRRITVLEPSGSP